MDSILNSIKKLLGIDSSYTHFDIDLIIHINTAFGILYQLGLTANPFSISDASSSWDDFLGGRSELEAVKTWMYLKVKSMFDPATVGAVATANENVLKELEWRIYSEINFPIEEEPN